MSTSSWDECVNRYDRLAAPYCPRSAADPAPEFLPEAVALLAAVDHHLRSVAPTPDAEPTTKEILAVLEDTRASRTAVCLSPKGGMATHERNTLMDVAAPDLAAVGVVARLLLLGELVPVGE